MHATVHLILNGISSRGVNYIGEKPDSVVIDRCMVFVDMHSLRKLLSHYENTPIQYAANTHSCQNDNFQMKYCNMFLLLLKT